MSDNLPPLIPAGICPASNPVALSTPVLLRSAAEGPPSSFPAMSSEAVLDPPGADNEIIIVANEPGAGGDLISVDITNPAVTMQTSVTVTDLSIQIIPGSRARLVVTGAGNPLFNGTYHFAGNYPGTTRPYWQKINSGSDVVRVSFPHPDSEPSGQWFYELNNVPHYASSSVTYNAATQPESLVFSVTGSGTAPPPTSVGGVTSAAQAIAAINASEAYNLIAAASYGAATGPVGFLSAVFLSGGSDGALGTPPAAIGQLCRVGPYTIIPPRTEAYDWFIAETMGSWRQVFE